MDFPALSGSLAMVLDTVARHQSTAGWTHRVRVIAVTKTHGPGAVRAAVAAGLTDVGENRVQEALEKQDALVGVPVEWHLIGTLQRNKARHAVGRFGLIHSVDRADLAAELQRRLPAHGRQAVLVQTNCSDEPQKGGVEPEKLPALLEALAAMERVEVRGLMTMSALTDDVAEQRRAFRRLRQLRDAGEQRGYRLPELSMGMSGDYGVAVEEGATMIRLGTVLFGERG
ncbi:MAG TPA: YggS family pyridoxal phosphate-dependent enzyme [Gemmatimonadales bacterium]|nr:YggS family pyridoxal phosphate-dependent enzyme [Gemmatimonadales bacterium]